jgi:hypothetical protein
MNAGRCFARPDWMLVACDMAGLQDRGLAHYLAKFDGGVYAATFADPNADTHWASAIALGLVLPGMVRDKQNKLHTALREGAKRFRYAFLYGSGALLSGIIIAEAVRVAKQIDSEYGTTLAAKLFAGAARPNEATLRRVGKQALDAFMAATPGLLQLRRSVVNAHDARKYLAGLDGRRIPTRAQYTALNYQICASEAVLCKDWLVNVRDELGRRFRYGWDGDVVLVLWIHDELIACCRPEIATEVGELMVKQARAAGVHYGFKCPLDASFTVGKSWAGDAEITAFKSDGQQNVLLTALLTGTAPNETTGMTPTTNAPRGAAPDPEMLEHARYWVREREAMRRRKEAGEDPPYSADPNLAGFRYTNVCWEYDRQSKWWLEHVRDPYRDHEDLIFAAIVRVLVNKDTSLEQIGIPFMPWPEKRARFIEMMNQKGAWNAAYMISGGGKGNVKAEYVAGNLDIIWSRRAELRPRPGMTFAALHERLMARCPCLASFLAAQVLVNMRGVEPLASAPDVMTFAASGPGSERGLGRLFFRDPNRKFSKMAFTSALARFAEAIEPTLREIGIPDELIHRHNLQNICCELSKYLKLVTGEGKPKQNYGPRAVAPRARASSAPPPPPPAPPTPPLASTIVPLIAPSLVPLAPELGAPVLTTYAPAPTPDDDLTIPGFLNRTGAPIPSAAPVSDGTHAALACAFLAELFDGSTAPFYLASLANDDDRAREGPGEHQENADHPARRQAVEAARR